MSTRETRIVLIGDLEVEECVHCGTFEPFHDDTLNGIGCNISRALNDMGNALGESLLGPRRWARVKPLTSSDDTPKTGR